MARELLAPALSQSAACVLVDHARHFRMRASVSRTALAPQDAYATSRLGGLLPFTLGPAKSGCGQVASHIMFDSTSHCLYHRLLLRLMCRTTWLSYFILGSGFSSYG